MPEQSTKFRPRKSPKVPVSSGGDGKKDLSKLTKKKVMGKDGKMHTVWVKIGEKIGKWKERQQQKYVDEADHDKYEEGEHSPKTIGSILQKKAKGVVKALKHEVHEWKEAGKGWKKVFTGQKPTKAEGKAMLSTAIHAAFVAGTAMYGAHTVGAFAVKAAIGFLEHTGVMAGGHALLFAKAEEGEMTDEEYNEILEKMVTEMGQYLENHYGKSSTGQESRQKD